jgi:hypothetical protein
MGLKFIAPNTKSISVKITASGGFTAASYEFPTQQDLQNRKIIAIESFCDLDFTFDPNNSAVRTLPVLLFNQAFLSVYNSAVRNPNMAARTQQAGLFYDKIPLCKMRTMNNYIGAIGGPSNANDIFIIRPTEINWNKTKVEFPTPVAFTGTYYATFVVSYLDINDNGDWWLRAMGFPGTKKKVSGESIEGYDDISGFEE